jgi:hypothetical protein
MDNIPPIPTFPKGCTISILILISLFIISIIIDKYTKKKDPNNPTKTISNNYVVLILVISSLLLVIIGSTCSWWYNMEKRAWTYKYGSPVDKTFQLATDVIDVFN